LALEHPVHDCIYLAVAEATSRPFVTADARLVAALADTAFSTLAISFSSYAAGRA